MREESQREEARPAPRSLQTPNAEPWDVRGGWGWFHVGLDLSVDCCTRRDFNYSNEHTLVSDEKTSKATKKQGALLGFHPGEEQNNRARVYR